MLLRCTRMSLRVFASLLGTLLLTAQYFLILPLFALLARRSSRRGMRQVWVMADVINFNKARKAKVRADRKGQAAANRVQFGRTKAEKIRDRGEKERADRMLDGTKREG